MKAAPSASQGAGRSSSARRKEAGESCAAFPEKEEKVGGVLWAANERGRPARRENGVYEQSSDAPTAPGRVGNPSDTAESIPPHVIVINTRGEKSNFDSRIAHFDIFPHAPMNKKYPSNDFVYI